MCTTLGGGGGEALLWRGRCYPTQAGTTPNLQSYYLVWGLELDQQRQLYAYDQSAVDAPSQTGGVGRCTRIIPHKFEMQMIPQRKTHAHGGGGGGRASFEQGGGRGGGGFGPKTWCTKNGLTRFSLL